MGHVVAEQSSPNWMMSILGVFGLVVVAAVVVLLLVSNADFDTGPPKAPPVSGTCEPFCTVAVPPPAPGIVP